MQSLSPFTASAAAYRALAVTLYNKAIASDLLRKIAETFGTRVLGMAITVVTSIIVARALGPDGRGRFAAAAAMAAIGMQFGNLGLHASNTYYVARDRRSLPTLLGNSLFVSLGIGGIVAFALWLLSLWQPEWFPIRSRELLAITLVMMPVGLAAMLLQNLLLGLSEFRTYNTIDIVTKFGYVVLIVVIIALHDVTAESALFIGLMVSAWICVWSFWVLQRRVKSKPLISYDLFVNHVRYGFKAYVVSLAGFMVLKIDLLMVKSMLGPEQTGYYSIAASVADILNILPMVVGVILFPKLSAMADARDRWHLARRATFVLGAIMIPLSLTMAVLAEPLIRLMYGAEFLPAVAPLRVLCGAMVFYGAVNVVSNYMAATGFPVFAVWSWLVVSVMNVSINLILIPRYGIYGAACTSLICYASILVLEYCYAVLQTQGVKNERNFEALYAEETDPWDIGNADSERYNLYYDLIKEHAASKRHVLDIGCGFGAFLARFHNDFEQLTGLEVSHNAIEKGQQRYPFIRFVQGSADNLGQVIEDDARFDVIIFSDVIYYMDEQGKRAALRWIAEHLQPDGVAFIAAWCPGGDSYLEYDELKRLVQINLGVEYETSLESQHAVFVANRRRRFIAITIDYETWHPIPEGESINWENDIFKPAEDLMRVCEQEQVPLTMMAEMGEYFWLCEHEPAVARRMEQQWVDLIRRGHDIQLHLHPSWMPETGARYENGEWSWDWTKAKADDYPGDLTALIGRCKSTLETLLCPVNPAYRVTSFRAGYYQVQPFGRLYEALTSHGIFCDSSIYAGGYDRERGIDFRSAYSRNHPYYADPDDPQLQAASREKTIVEIPIFTFEPRQRFRPQLNQRWCLDNEEGALFAERLIFYVEQRIRTSPTTEAYRRYRRLASYVANSSWRLKPMRRWLRPLLPPTLAYAITNYPLQPPVNHGYFVMIGHTKGKHDFAGIAANLRRLKEDGRFEFVTLSEMAATAKHELEEDARRKEQMVSHPNQTVA